MSSPRSRRPVIPVLAAGLVVVALPWTAAPAHAEQEKPFSGYSSEARATPVLLEIYEPTIPVPATPQLELSFGYSTVEADSSSSKGRSSYLWPGDPVGEGLKTIVEQLGLPPELADPVAARGYPVQVNSQYPAGPETQADEPFPGTVMRTTSGDGAVSASTGFSSDCDVAAPAAEGGQPEMPGLPGVPGLPELPTLPGLGDLTAAFPGLETALDPLLAPAAAGAPAAAPAPAAPGTAGPAEGESTPEEAAACQIPPALSALVDLGGYVSTTRSKVADGRVVSTARASLGDVRLVGGIVTISGIHTTATTSSDGTTATPSGQARFGTITIAGQEFSFGPDGFTAVGQGGAIPGLPDEAEAALATLGLTLTLPQPTTVVAGDKASTVLSALQVEIDTAVLAPVLSEIPLSTVLKDVPFPPEAAVLKSLLGALPNLAPRLVLTLGAAESKVDTVQGIKLPSLPTPETDSPAETDDEDGDDGEGEAPVAGGGSATPPSSTTAAPTTTGGGSPAAGELPAAAPVASGLPPLFSIPGMLLLGGIALACVAGSYLRRLGVAALGGGAACSHGLDSGLPDLRKA